ncbi:MAG: glutaredoxin family protein [Solirubrobacteraceae bacterium]
MRDLTVYTADPCRLCHLAKALLEARGISYREVNLTKDPDGRAELARRTGLMTFPQIVIDDEPLGGLTELRAADSDGRLQELLVA